MYVKTCAGGFPNPISGGKFEIFGFRATVSTPTASSRIQMWDDSNIKDGGTGYVYTIDDVIKTKIADIKGVEDVDANLEVFFPEPLKTRRGISIAFTNLVPGTFMLYVR